MRISDWSSDVCSSDLRLVEVAQLLQAAEAADTVVAVDGVAASRRLQVPAGGEEPVPRRGDNGDAQLGIVAEVLEGLAQEPAGREVDGIGLRPVERDFQDGAAAVAANDVGVGIRHRDRKSTRLNSSH